MRVAVIFVASTLFLIGCAYKAGTLAQNKREGFAGKQATIGCLDIAIERQLDRGSAPVMSYELANRCERELAIDLAFVNVIGRTADGVEVALAPHDPERMRPVVLDKRSVGSEAVKYSSREQLGQVCVDVASFAGETPSQWMCFGNTEAVALAH